MDEVLDELKQNQQFRKGLHPEQANGTEQASDTAPVKPEPKKRGSKSQIPSEVKLKADTPFPSEEKERESQVRMVETSQDAVGRKHGSEAGVSDLPTARTVEHAAAQAQEPFSQVSQESGVSCKTNLFMLEVEEACLSCKDSLSSRWSKAFQSKRLLR